MKYIITGITIFLFGIIIGFVCTIDQSSLIRLNTLSEIFNKLAIGIAALTIAYFGSTYFFEQVLIKRKIDSYRSRYSYDDYGKTWKIITRKDQTDEPYVLDIKSKEIHYVWNTKTIYDLGWQFYKRIPIIKKRFDSFKRGDYIKTRGELGE